MTAQTRRWIENVFLSRGLPRPQIQIETNMILMAPSLIHQTEWLTFTSRRHVHDAQSGGMLSEVRLAETTLTRRFDIVYRRTGFISPAAQRIIDVLRTQGRTLFADRQP